MSWDQGIQLREDLPEKFVQFLEDKYFEMFSERGRLNYITWFGMDSECFADFYPGHSLKLEVKK